MDKKENTVEVRIMDNKFTLALKAIQTAQHQVKSGHEVNVSHVLEEVRKNLT